MSRYRSIVQLQYVIVYFNRITQLYSIYAYNSYNIIQRMIQKQTTKPKPILQQLRKYNQKLTTLQQIQQQRLEQLKKQYTEIFIKQLQSSAKQHYTRYKQHRKSLKEEGQAVRYYLTVAQLATTHNNSEQQQQVSNHQNQQQFKQNGSLVSHNEPGFEQTCAVNEQDSKNWCQIMQKVNLYSLFKKIDDKLVFNQSLLKHFRLVCQLPIKGENYQQNLTNRVSILQQQLQEYSNLIARLLNKCNRNCKQEHQTYLAIQDKYTNLLKGQQKDTQSQFKIKDTLNYAVSALMASKYLRSVELAIVNHNGIVGCQQYQKLGAALLNHRFYLRSINIKMMDMEFCQQKCDILKRYLKKMKTLEKLHLLNYYSECKLGQFVDFAWHPYRKNVNIKSAVWK